jgi:subtilase family serine protease
LERGTGETVRRGGSVTLILKADSESRVADANRANNELSWVLSNVPVKKVDGLVLGDMGGITINYVKGAP